MTSEQVYKRRRWAGYMGSALLVASAVGVVGTIVVLLAHGLTTALVAGLLTVMTFALSQLFELVSDLIGLLATSGKNPQAEPGREPLL